MKRLYGQWGGMEGDNWSQYLRETLEDNEVDEEDCHLIRLKNNKFIADRHYVFTLTEARPEECNGYVHEYDDGRSEPPYWPYQIKARLMTKEEVQTFKADPIKHKTLEELHKSLDKLKKQSQKISEEIAERGK